MKDTTQISAFISKETKSKVDSYVNARGIKKAFLVEEALLHYLQAVKEIPEDMIIPTQLTLSPQAIIDVINELNQNKEPSAALRSLLQSE